MRLYNEILAGKSFDTSGLLNILRVLAFHNKQQIMDIWHNDLVPRFQRDYANWSPEQLQKTTLEVEGIADSHDRFRVKVE